ncbi:phosphoribosylglycinamide formyltransferase [uncultured Halovibrio sp.]|uniref:phosphoribosylglycinamide formyltransferase n=1 Tax=uncultured Halovibrio sp. TaxID=985049 RepID=UPI0025E8AB83|nr:phosphoribosylglycinamide formyltransferase [uncultured Halovibrio sp.]
MPDTLPRIVVLISGGGTNLQALIDAEAAGTLDGTIAGVISNRTGVKGLDRAENAGIPAQAIPHRDHDSRESFDQALMAAIDGFRPDLVVLAGFMRILTDAFVQHYQGRLLNIHPSLLPAWPGLHTHRKVLEAGEKEHGATVHFVTEELDGGPRIIQGRVRVHPDDNEDSLAGRVGVQERRIYPEAVRWFCQGRLRLVQGRAQLDGTPLDEPVDPDSQNT